MRWTDRLAGLLLALSLAASANAQSPDSDGDGIRDQFETGDTDTDQIEDRLDRDDDNDGIWTGAERADPNGDGDPSDALDTDGTDGPNYLDGDDDGDDIGTLRECATAPSVDLNVNGIPDYLDAASDGSQAPRPGLDGDADGDGLPNALEDRNGNRVYGEEDADDDLVPDYLDPDDDGDGLQTQFERGDPASVVDTDRNGLPDYLQTDDDGDGVPTAQEGADGAILDGNPADAVSTAHSIPDYLNPDDDDDGVPTLMERPLGVSRDSDGDGLPDYLDEDDDQDLLLNEGASDADGDGIPNYLDADDDGDGVASVAEIVIEIDSDRDGAADPVDTDDDGDGLTTMAELGPNPGQPQDSDADGRRDYLDPDDDGDGVPTLQEHNEALADFDHDGRPDYLDPDDDADGIPTSAERGATQDIDGDGFANWLDLDADGDGASDAEEGTADADGDGIPNFLDRPAPSADAGADAGAAPADGGPDARAYADTGLRVVSPENHDDGCSAAPGAGRSAPSGWGFALLALGWLVRRRRSKRSDRSRIAAHFASAVCALAPFAASACGDDDDAQISIDGGWHPLDAALDASGVDTGAEDAAVASDAGGLGSECVVEGELPTVSIEEPVERGWAAFAQDDAVHVAYVAATCTGIGAATGTRIDYLSVTSTGPFGSARTLTPDAEGTCYLRRSPSLAGGGANGALDAYFTANAAGSFDLYRQDVALAAQAARITEDADGALDAELATAAVSFGDSALLAYVNQGAFGMPSQLVTRRPGLAENEIVAPAAGQAPSRLKLTAWPSAAIAGVLGWVSDLAGGLSLRYQPLTLAGTASGAPVELSTAVGNLSGLDFAVTRDRAAVVYTVQTDSIAALRFRSLDPSSGQPNAEEVTLTSANRSVGNPSIAPYARGYVIAFRELPERVEASASLRLLFVDADGHAGGERRLATAARGGSGSEVFVMNDGRLIVLWSDYGTNGGVLRALRARCL